MNLRTKLLMAALGTTGLLVARPGFPLTTVEKSEAQLTLSQTAFCDGSVRTQLAPGSYDVRVSKNASGAMIAILSQGGARKGETRAITAPGTNQILIGLLLPAVQKVREAAVPPPAGPPMGGKPGSGQPGTMPGGGHTGTMGTQKSN